MTSFGYRLNPRYAIKECSSCETLYTRDCSCSKGSVEDKIFVPKPPKNCARCTKCGHPVKGPYCQGCAFLREKLEEDLVTYFQNFQDTFESSDDSTNVVNAPREPFVVKQDHGVNPPHIDKCCCDCVNALDGIFCQQCICKSCGKGNVEEKILVPKPLKNYAKCGHPVNGHYCQGCALLRERLEEDLVSYFQNFQNKSESSDDSTNVVNAPREPFKQEEKRIEEEQAASARYWKILVSLKVFPIPSKDHVEIVINSNDDISSSDDESLHEENFKYVEPSPYDSELVSLEAA
nr:hypothetical protein [Tanacetum cinerariifolium]